MQRYWTTAYLVAVLAHSLLGQCGPQAPGAPVIRLNASAIDRPTEFEVSGGAPGAHWVCFIDTSTGPTETPFGTLCFGSTASILFNSYALTVPRLDADGTATVTVTPPQALAVLEGLDFFIQAVVADPAAPFGVRVSVPESVSFRRPRVFVGTAQDVFTSPAQSIVAVEPTTAAIDYRVTPSAPSVRAFNDLIACPEERCLASLDFTGTIRVFEEGTGAQRFVMPPSQFVSQIALGHDGRQLLIARDFDILRLDLTNGTTFRFAAQPGLGIVPHPSRNEVMIVGLGTLLRHNYRTGAVLAPIPIPLPFVSSSNYTTLIVGQRMFVITSGSQLPLNIEIAVVDLDTNVVTNTSPVPLGIGNVLSANFAIGAAGPGLWLTTLSEIIEVDPVTLTARQTIPTSEATTAAVSGGGTELLLNAGLTISKLDLATNVITPIATTVNNQSLVLATTPDRAYFVDNGTLYGMATDPTTTVVPVAVLYPASQAAVGTSFVSTHIIAE